MDDQNEQTTEPTGRTRTPKSTGQSPAPKTAAPTRTSTRPKPKPKPKAEAPVTTGSKRSPQAATPLSTESKRAPKAQTTPTATTGSIEAQTAEATGVGRRTDADEPGDGAPSRDEMSIAFTPGQMAVGGAIVAGLLVFGVRLLLGRRRGRG